MRIGKLKYILTSCPRFDTAAQDSNPGSLSRAYEALTTALRRYDYLADHKSLVLLVLQQHGVNGPPFAKREVENRLGHV